ncbi:MAG: Rieske 2Fe-2S domain-containing protein [Proteobacteria bacterium]|nr:Rieske 2Fe-2S domain-containing protein [Pseudomonadota bacterium]
MLTAEQNERVTRTGPETPTGSLLRRYWQPAALVDELAGERPAVAVRLLGEDLVLYRDEGGGYALVGRRCPHRGADLAYGRLEDGGLRCPFHGWLFDGKGACLEQPAEPADSDFHTTIRHTAYPCVERNGIVFAYLGPGAPPPLPGMDCFVAPDSHSFAFKGLMEANWLQALEVGIDPAHASFLHRFFEDGDPAATYGRQFRDRTDGAEIPVTRLLREHTRPDIGVDPADHGFRITSRRDLGNQGTHVRITNLVFPNAICIPLSTDMVLTQWHVPIDDVTCYWYGLFTAFEQAVDKETMRAARLELYDLPDYRPKRGKHNNYGYDPAEQKTQTFTGMGMDINVHDNWAVESPGPIHDRTTETLGTTDKAIIANRRLLMQAIDAVAAGKAPAVTLDDVSGPVAVDTIATAGDWQAHWKQTDRARRDRSPWAKSEANK